MTEEKTVPLFNAHKSVTGRDGGPYLDEVQDRAAEVERARVEDREPDLESPPATAGTPLIQANTLLANAGTHSTPSQEKHLSNLQGAVGASAKESWPVEPVSEMSILDSDKSTSNYNPADPTVIPTEDIYGNKNSATGTGEFGSTGFTAIPEEPEE